MVRASVRAGWLAYGAALNEIRASHGGNDKAFGQAVEAAGLDKWPGNVLGQVATVEIERKVRAAAMWAEALEAAIVPKTLHLMLWMRDKTGIYLIFSLVTHLPSPFRFWHSVHRGTRREQ